MIDNQILWELQASQHLAEFCTDNFDGGDLTGRLLSLSDELLLLHVFSHDLAGFDGYSIVRREDVTLLRWAERRIKLWERQLAQLPGLAATPDPDVNLQSWFTAIQTLSDDHLLTFHRQEADTSEVYIGKIVEVYSESILVEAVSSGGVPDGFVAMITDEITRIDFGSRYSQSLEKMSGFHT